MMNREELEGVIGHEMSHIKNYDVRLLLIVSTLIGMAGLLASLLWRSAFFMRPRGRDSGQVTVLVLAAGVLLGVVALVFGPLIRLALSRRREELADVSGVELTRNPAGLISALQKLAANDQPFAKFNHATAAMCIDDPLQHHEGWFHHLFDTHPPIASASPSSSASPRARASDPSPAGTTDIRGRSLTQPRSPVTVLVPPKPSGPGAAVTARGPAEAPQRRRHGGPYVTPARTLDESHPPPHHRRTSGSPTSMRFGPAPSNCRRGRGVAGPGPGVGAGRSIGGRRVRGPRALPPPRRRSPPSPQRGGRHNPPLRVPRRPHRRLRRRDVSTHMAKGDVRTPAQDPPDRPILRSVGASD